MTTTQLNLQTSAGVATHTLDDDGNATHSGTVTAAALAVATITTTGATDLSGGQFVATGGEGGQGGRGGAAGAVQGFINGKPIGDPIANAVTITTALTPCVAVSSRSAAARILTLDYVWVQQNR